MRKQEGKIFLPVFLKFWGEKTKRVSIKVCLFDPIADEEIPVSDGVDVEIVKIKSRNPTVPSDPLRLILNSEEEIFYTDAPPYGLTRRHHVRVRFSHPNFSRTLKKFVASDEIDQASLPIYTLSHFPDLESDENDRYRAEVYAPWRRLQRDMTMDRPSTIRVPIRQLYNIGHRGAPYYFPENTIASFRKAVELGANGLEFDLCFTKDKKIAVLHDPKPSLGRGMVEKFPFELVSLEFQPQNGRMVPIDEYHVVNLALDQVRQIYYYRRTEGLQRVGDTIPDLDEFLRVVQQEVDRLELLYFDVKNPDWDEKRNEGLFVEYGFAIGSILKHYATLPRKLIICNARPKVLGLLKLGIEKAGETRCEFAYDAEGSAAACLGALERKCRQWPELLQLIIKVFLAFLKFIAGRIYTPLRIARRMENKAVAIGTFLRPGNFEEIEQAIHDRDCNPTSPVETVIHWTLNDQEHMCRSLSAGVNGIITDKPDELKRLLRRLGIAIP